MCVADHADLGLNGRSAFAGKTGNGEVWGNGSEGRLGVGPRAQRTAVR